MDNTPLHSTLAIYQMCATRGAGDWTGLSGARWCTFFLFVNDLPDVLEALTLLLVDDIKMATLQTPKNSLQRSPITAWYW